MAQKSVAAFFESWDNGVASKPLAHQISYQPGGTFMATTGKWATRSTGKMVVDTTGLGRWSGLTFLGKRNKRLTVLTAYRSPRQQPSSGFGFYDQQYALLLSQGVKKPNVRKQFITDITSLINDTISQLKSLETLLSVSSFYTPLS